MLSMSRCIAADQNCSWNWLIQLLSITALCAQKYKLDLQEADDWVSKND